jgi:hypothetical protein
VTGNLSIPAPFRLTAPDLLNFQLANSPFGENLACRPPGVDQDCLCRLVELRAGGEEMTAARLKELEEMAAKLVETAGKLPSEQDRHNALQEIERFRARITALQLSGMAQSPQPYDLVTRPCTIHAGRFRWDIRENGRPIQSSIESFATEQEAHADGRHELEKIILVSRL